MKSELKLDQLKSVKPKCSLSDIKSAKRVYIYGAGGFAESLKSSLTKHDINISSYLVTKEKTQYPNILPINKYQYMDGDLILIAIHNRSFNLNDLLQILKKYNIPEASIVFPWDYYNFFRLELGWRFWLESNDYLSKNIDKLKSVESLLSDDESRAIFTNICLYRSGLNNLYSGYKSTDEQYFNQLTIKNTNKKISYIDIGAFDGDSFNSLIEICAVEKALLFEPDPINFENLVTRIKSYQETIEVLALPLGIGNNNQIIRFNSQ